MRLAEVQTWPLLRKRAERGAVHRDLEIGVVEDDERIDAAQLQVGALELAAGALGDARAHRGGAGEGDAGQLRIVDQRLADLRAGAGDHVDHAGRQVTRARARPGAASHSGVSSDGLMTTALPAASAGAIFHTRSRSG